MQMEHRVLPMFAGAKATLPLIIGAIPFGFIYGALATQSGISLFETCLMSMIVFAGSAQFIAVGLLSLDTSPLVIAGTVFLVNMRHLLYSAWVAPYLSHLNSGWRSVLSFGLTDEVFAVVSQHLPSSDKTNRAWYMFGSIFAMWLFWQCTSTLGYLASSEFPIMFELGLEIAMPITFLSMTVLLLKDNATFAAVAAAGLLAFYTTELPYQLGLCLSSVVGIAVGFYLDKHNQSKKGQTA